MARKTQAEESRLSAGGRILIRTPHLRRHEQANKTSRLPTIIVFTREPVPGSTKTRLAARLGACNAASLADAFTRDALEKVHELRLPLVIAGSTSGSLSDNRYFGLLARRFGATLVDQGLGTLGTRMARVLTPFAPDGVLLIGTDTPSLPSSALRRAVSLVRHHHVVLGPSLDGGYYLIGIHGAVPDVFRGIRWGGAMVLQQTVERLVRFGIRPALAPTWYDVDRWSDVILLAEHLRRVSQRGGVRCSATARVLARLGVLQSCL
jgi:rSAM/selenodomain-associated transferase 1